MAKLNITLCPENDRVNLKVAPGVHALLKSYAIRNNITVSLAANLLIPRAIAHEWGQPLPSITAQLAGLIKQRVDPWAFMSCLEEVLGLESSKPCS